MKLLTAPRLTPRLVEDPDGDVVQLELLDDRDLCAMLQDTATVIAVMPPGTARNGPERQIVRILEGYRTGALETRYQLDDFGAEYDVRLLALRNELEQKQLWLLAGCAQRPTSTGDDEAVSVVAFVSEPYGYCDVVVSLDDDEVMLSA